MRAAGIATALLLLPTLGVGTQGYAMTCEPYAWPEAVTIHGVSVSATLGPLTMYVITSGSSTIGQSDVQLYQETNGARGLQLYAECGVAPDLFLLSTCLVRQGAFAQLECPEVQTGDLAEAAAQEQELVLAEANETPLAIPSAIPSAPALPSL